MQEQLRGLVAKALDFQASSRDRRQQFETDRRQELRKKFSVKIPRPHNLSGSSKIILST
jgi:hypothetical protein